MKRIGFERSVMTDAQRHFFKALESLEPAADMAGSECGLQGLNDEGFGLLTRATVKRIAVETGVGTSAAIMAREHEILRNRQEALREKIRQERAAWRSAGDAASAAGWGFDWRRLALFLVMAACAGLFLRLAWKEVRWEVFALLAVTGALAGLSPSHLMVRVRAGMLGLLELVGHAVTCLRAGWGGLRLARLEPQTEAMSVLVEALDQWQEAGEDTVMGRFRYHYQRGVAAAKLGMDRGGFAP